MNIFEEVKKLNLPFGEYMVIGSGILGVHNIREIGDVDLLVTQKLFDELKEQGWEYDEKDIQGQIRQRLLKGDAEVYRDFWLYGVSQDVNRMIEEAEVVQGISFMSLTELLKMKNSLGRPKDIADIKLIEEYLQNK